jgi:hypothetical protein
VISSRVLLAVFLSLLPNVAWSRVMLRWTAADVPPPRRLGVSDLVIAWDHVPRNLTQSAAHIGYTVYAEAPPEQAAVAAQSANKSGIAGVIVNPGDTPRGSIAKLVRALQAKYPKIRFLVENPDALQPKMRGTLVMNRDGVLLATSPTAQPWIDTNLALVRLEQAFWPEQTPLYSFAWELTGAAKQEGPAVTDYALAIAEAGAFQADVILTLPENLQFGLLHNEPGATNLWNEVRNFVRFYSIHRQQSHESNIAVITDDDPSSFEPINLLVRHNLDVRVVPAVRFSAAATRGFDVLVFLTPPPGAALPALTRYTRRGGTVVLLNPEKKKYPWQSAQPAQSPQNSASYSVGSGRVIELLQPISDPESFAQDIRTLVPDDKVHLGLWNALTVIGLMDHNDKNENIELLNYAGDPLQVQVRVKGSYQTVRYETTEHGCCAVLHPSVENGFTEFTVPSLEIAGRVHLESGGSQETHSSPPKRALGSRQ